MQKGKFYYKVFLELGPQLLDIDFTVDEFKSICSKFFELGVIAGVHKILEDYNVHDPK